MNDKNREDDKVQYCPECQTHHPWDEMCPVDKDKPVNLHDTTDALVWAKEWLKTIKKHPSIPTDEGTMIGWFANAIMAGYDSAMNKKDDQPSHTTVKEGEELPNYDTPCPICKKAANLHEPWCPKVTLPKPSPTPSRQEWERWLINRPQYWASERAIEIWFLSMPGVPK